MNVCMSRWGGEGINQFPGSEEKLAVFGEPEASWEDRGVIQLFCLKKTHSKWQKYPKKPTTSLSPNSLGPVAGEGKTQLSLNTDKSI